MRPVTAWPRIAEMARRLDFEGQLDVIVGGFSLGMKIDEFTPEKFSPTRKED